MAFYTINATYDPTALETFGFVGDLGAFAIGGLGLVTFGFIWGVADIWTPNNNPVNVTWQPVPCATNCF
jgi:hypothetical protein